MTVHQPLRIVTSCRSRFHIFDQARELARHGALHQLITDYPKSWPARFGIPREKVRPLLLSGLINHGLGRVNCYLPVGIRARANHWIHDRFSRQLAMLIPRDAQYFIGLSSFCLEALQASRELGIPCAVDHGSLHQKDDTRLVREEAERWGVAIPADAPPHWLIEKEDCEFQTAENVFVLSNVARDSMVRCGVPAAKVFVNHCGVGVATFSPGEKGDKVFRVIQVGHISLRKGVLTLLDAFARAGLRRAELWFVGGGLEISGLEETIKKLRTSGVVFRPPVPQERLHEYYNQSSALVMASVADGFAMVVPQAMACGLPVIVTENVGAKELITDGVNGFVVPVGQPETIAERLRRLYHDPESCRAMGQAARLTVEHGCTWKDYGDRLLRFLSLRLVR